MENDVTSGSGNVWSHDPADIVVDESADRLLRMASRLAEAPVAALFLLRNGELVLRKAAPHGVLTAEEWERRGLALPRDGSELLTSPAAGEEHALAAVPLLAEGEYAGTLCVLDSRARPWTEGQLQGLRDAAAAGAREIGLRQAKRRAQAGEAYLSAIVESQQAIAAAGLDMDTVMAEIVKRAHTLTAAESAVVELAEGSHMVYAAVYGGASPHLGLRLNIHGSISGLSYRTREVLWSDDTDHDERVDRAACRAVGARSMVVVPLVGREVTAGVLKVYSSRPHAFGDRAVQTLRVLAALLASALHDAQQFAREQRLSERLGQSEQLYRSVFEGADEGYFLLDREGPAEFRYVTVNPALARILGRPAGAIAGKSAREVLPAEVAARVIPLYQQVFDTGRPVEIEHANTIDGRDIFTRTRYHPLRSEEGNVARVLGIVEDATERVRAARLLAEYSRELERSNRELQDFAYVASHDLQEPLRKVRAFGDRLQARLGADLDETAADYLHRMRSTAARMQALIQDLLSYSRVGTRDPVTVIVELEEIVRDVLVDLQASMESTGGEVTVGPLPAVTADPLLMRQLFQNLIGNALKYHRPGVPPRVRVSARGDDGAFECISVADNGIGIDHQYAERIFTPFERLHARSEYEGTGMGLAICRKIARRHGGDVTVSSTPGEGTTFSVTLPRGRLR